MATRVDVLSDTEERPSESLIESISAACRAAVERAGIDRDVEFACLLTDGLAMRRFNRQFRAIDRETDVLAFQRDESLPGGDIAIAIDHARAEADRNGSTIEAEVAYLTAHAALHLLGHDHKSDDDYARMLAEEDGVLAMIGVANPRRSEEAVRPLPEQ